MPVDSDGPRSCVILGAGRSGTSLAGGLFRSTRYYLGREPLPATPSNPHGYFEDREINAINEAILAASLRRLPFVDVVKYRFPAAFVRRLPWYRRALTEDQRWLAMQVRAVHQPDEHLAARIAEQTRRRPFCFKDPRFVHTLPAWRAWLPERMLVICVFRHPSETARSMVKDVASRPYLANLRLTLDDAYAVWRSSYRAVLALAATFHVVFVSYDGLIRGDVISRLEAEVGTALDASFIDPGLRHESISATAPAGCAALYDELCRRELA